MTKTKTLLNWGRNAFDKFINDRIYFLSQVNTYQGRTPHHKFGLSSCYINVKPSYLFLGILWRRNSVLLYIHIQFKQIIFSSTLWLQIFPKVLIFPKFVMLYVTIQLACLCELRTWTIPRINCCLNWCQHETVSLWRWSNVVSIILCATCAWTFEINVM